MTLHSTVLCKIIQESDKLKINQCLLKIKECVYLLSISLDFKHDFINIERKYKQVKAAKF